LSSVAPKKEGGSKSEVWAAIGDASGRDGSTNDRLAVRWQRVAAAKREGERERDGQ